ncbi:MAG: hypothetical protein HC905_28865 [Bacteroidales bacterium]|nr:hypothetical protein [Bacteroidales bacterium]
MHKKLLTGDTMNLYNLALFVLISFYSSINFENFGCSCTPTHGFLGYINEKTIVLKGEIVDVIYGDSIHEANFPKEVHVKIINGFGTIRDNDTIRLLSGHPGDCSIVFENYDIGEQYYFLTSKLIDDSNDDESNYFWVSSCGTSILKISNDLSVAKGLVKYKKSIGINNCKEMGN